MYLPDVDTYRKVLKIEMFFYIRKCGQSNSVLVGPNTVGWNSHRTFPI